MKIYTIEQRWEGGGGTFTGLFVVRARSEEEAIELAANTPQTRLVNRRITEQTIEAHPLTGSDSGMLYYWIT